METNKKVIVYTFVHVIIIELLFINILVTYTKRFVIKVLFIIVIIYCLYLKFKILNGHCW